jgi:chromosome partitioning protein
MPDIIALVGNKGGAGKTTLCVNLAAALAENNTVVVLDADPQQSSSQWYEIAEHGCSFQVINASDNINETLQEIDIDYSLCLIDCPPSVHSIQMQQALRLANLAIIPVQPSPLDLWATVHVENEVASACKDNPDLKAMLLINQFETRTQLSQLMQRALAELSLPAAQTSIKRRVVYRNSFLEGRTVHDIGRRGVAASEEIHQLIQEMEKYL